MIRCLDETAPVLQFAITVVQSRRTGQSHCLYFSWITGFLYPCATRLTWSESTYAGSLRIFRPGFISSPTPTYWTKPKSHCRLVCSSKIILCRRSSKFSRSVLLRAVYISEWPRLRFPTPLDSPSALDSLNTFAITFVLCYRAWDSAFKPAFLVFCFALSQLSICLLRYFATHFIRCSLLLKAALWEVQPCSVFYKKSTTACQARPSARIYSVPLRQSS